MTDPSKVKPALDAMDSAKPADGHGSMRIGPFTISVFPHGGYFIRHESNEGGQFRAELLEKAIADFYNEHF